LRFPCYYHLKFELNKIQNSVKLIKSNSEEKREKEKIKLPAKRIPGACFLEFDFKKSVLLSSKSV